MVINSKKELHEILNYERIRWKERPITNCLGWLKLHLLLLFHPGSPYLFMVCLRYAEYYKDRGGGRFFSLAYRYKLRKLQNKTGIDMWLGVAEKGVKINHGKCVISRSSIIGEDSIILSDVTLGGIGGLRDGAGAPKLGKRVFVSSGVRIIGPVTIADGVVIGANAVVTKSIEEPNITVAGVPARKISDKGSEEYIRTNI